jgi:hypothetical protein
MHREGGATSNVATPMTPLVTNHSPLLIQLMSDSVSKFNLAVSKYVSNEPAADESAFHPPYADLGAISIGWQAIGRTYHSTADIESRLLGYPELSMWTRSLAFVIDQLENYTKDDLEKDGTLVPEVSTYQSISLKMTFGNF